MPSFLQLTNNKFWQQSSYTAFRTWMNLYKYNINLHQCIINIALDLVSHHRQGQKKIPCTADTFRVKPLISCKFYFKFPMQSNTIYLTDLSDVHVKLNIQLYPCHILKPSTLNRDNKLKFSSHKNE